MELTYKIPSFEYMINSILEIETENMDDCFKGDLFYFYPSIDKQIFYKLEEGARIEYLTSSLRDIYIKEQDTFVQKINSYNQYWQENKEIIIEAFQDAFKINLKNELNDMVSYINLNPVCPRYLHNNTFDIFYFNSERGALGISLHEIVHFIWFKIWQEYFHDEVTDYELPHLKWVFSEMIPELIMRDERLRTRNPYFDGHCVYEYFYEIKIDEKPILDILFEMYSTLPMHEFMVKGYEFCQQHEEYIRSCMQ